MNVNTIKLPEQSAELNLTAELQGALYAASAYHRVTAIEHKHRRAYIVPAWMYEEFIKAGMESRPKPDWSQASAAEPVTPLEDAGGYLGGVF